MVYDGGETYMFGYQAVHEKAPAASGVLYDLHLAAMGARRRKRRYSAESLSTSERTECVHDPPGSALVLVRNDAPRGTCVSSSASTRRCVDASLQSSEGERHPS
jgi:hypothetical protein